MNLRHAYTRLRLNRDSVAAFAILASIAIGLLSLITAGLHYVGLFEAGSGQLYLGLGLGFIAGGIAVAIACHRMIHVMAQGTLASIAGREGRFADQERHARNAWDYGQRLAPDDPCRGRCLAELTRAARGLGNYDDAIAFGELRIQNEDAAWGPDSTYALWARLEVAEVFIDIARYPQATALLEQVPAGAAGDSLLAAYRLGLLGRLWLETESYAQAESTLQQAYDLVRPLPEWISHGSYLTFNLVEVLARHRKLAEAEAILDEAQQAITAAYPPESWHHGYLALARGSVRYAEGRPTEAEQFWRQAVAHHESSGRQPPMVMWFSLANACKVQEKWAEAEEFYRKALRYAEECRAPEHPALAALLESYAELLHQLGRTDEAQARLHHAHQIREFLASPRPA